jgi:hypothetical protein
VSYIKGQESSRDKSKKEQEWFTQKDSEREVKARVLSERFLVAGF